MKQVRVIISGRVQGVWFRGWTLETAKLLGLDGWVRNRHDGSVEAVFAGEDDKVEKMLAACRQGPPMARVTDVLRFADDAPLDPGFHPKPGG